MCKFGFAIKHSQARGILLSTECIRAMDLPETYLDRETIEKYLCNTGMEKLQRNLVHFVENTLL